jgi:hypothetical protein
MGYSPCLSLRGESGLAPSNTNPTALNKQELSSGTTYSQELVLQLTSGLGKPTLNTKLPPSNGVEADIAFCLDELFDCVLVTFELCEDFDCELAGGGGGFEADEDVGDGWLDGLG